jgi:hypothetical protein
MPTKATPVIPTYHSELLNLPKIWILAGKSDIDKVKITLHFPCYLDFFIRNIFISNLSFRPGCFIQNFQRIWFTRNVKQRDCALFCYTTDAMTWFVASLFAKQNNLPHAGSHEIVFCKVPFEFKVAFESLMSLTGPGVDVSENSNTVIMYTKIIA